MEQICDILAASAARQREQENAGAFSNALDEIKDDMHKMEEDSKKIDCYAILDLIIHSFKCFIDSIKCCFKIKIS